MLKIFNQSHEAVGYIKKYQDCKIESVLSTAEKTLSFTYLGKAGKIDYEYYVQTKDAEYVVKSIRITSDGYPEYTATLNMEELESKTWETFLAKDSSLLDAANLALAGTGWRVEECTVDKKRSMGLQNVTSKVVLQKICTVFMCEMRVDSKAKTVSFKEKFGEDKGVYFLQGLNLRKLTLSGDTYDFYTRIIPVGKDGLKITSVNDGKEYIDNFQYSKKIIPYIWQDTSYEDATALMEDATEKLKDLSIPKKSYTVDVRDLAYRSAEYSILEYNLGDTITLIDRKTGIRDTQRITKIVEYPGDPDKNTCDIANTRETFDEIQSRLKEAASIIEAVKNLDGSINGNTVDKVTTDQILGFKDGVESEIQNSNTISGLKTDIKAVTADIGTIQSTYLKAADADIKFATIENLKATTATVHDLNVDYAKFKTATADEFAAKTAQIKKVSGDLASFKTGEFENLKSKQADFETATAKNFTATSARIDTVTGDLASYKNVVAENFSAANGKIENLETTTLKAADAKLTYATIESLNALKGDVADLNVGSLTARVATIEGAYISKTETKQLLAGYADIKLANVAAGTIGSALIGDGAITDAKIASVSANKLTAGTIDASKINVTNMNADNLTVGTINGQRIGDKSIDLTKLSKEVPTKAYLDSVQNGLQSQIDSAIQTYTSDTIPTLKNSPAASWTDNSTRAKHVGDICYVTNAGGNADGYCYRFTNTGTSTAPVYEWVLIKDSDVNKALQELVTVNGDLTGLKSFQSETSSWRTSTDTEISSVKTRTTTIETTYSTKEETKSAADSAKSSAIASAKGYTDTATKDMATSTAVANAKKEAISEAAKDATSKADAAKSSAISTAASDATKKADAAKSSAISAAATDATTKANTAKSEAISTAASDATKKANDAKSSAISTAASDATKKANDAKSAAISAASSDATSKANTAKSEAISAAATDATTKANAALNSAKGYADDAVDNIAVGGRNIYVGTKNFSTYKWPNMHAWDDDGTYQGFAVKKRNGRYQALWQPLNVKSGEIYTLSAYVKIAATGYYACGPYMSDGATCGYKLLKQKAPQTENVWERVFSTYEITSDGVMYFGIEADHDTTIWVCGLKLEKGNKATDWTPAPEDTEEAINTKVSTTVFNEVKQTVDANSATITKLTESVSKKADGSTVESLANTVNTVKQTTDANTALISTLTTTVNKKANSSTVDTISKTLNAVKQTADSNSANISELSKTVSTKADGSTVETLTNRVSTAEQNLDGFKTTVSKTYVTSQTYNEKVTNLESGISAAQGTANTAKSTADAATTTANTAKSTADAATTTANTAKSTADTASKTASAAKTTAEGAVSTANTAKSTADSASKTASSAKSTADSAVNTANTAKSTAEGAVSTANSAKSTADAASNTINRGLNKWLIRQFASSSTADADATIDKIVGKDIAGTYEYADSDLNISQMGLILEHYYNGYAVTAVKFSKTTSIETRFPSDDGGTVYLNGTQVAHNAESSKDGVSCTLSFKKGWNVLEVVWHEGTGGNGFKFTTTISKHANCERMDCYASVDTVETAYTKATTKKVVSMSAEVTKTAEGLTSTANKVTTLTNDLAGVSTRLGTAESKITQNAESISAKVSTTDFNTFKTSNTTAINDAKSSAISTAASDATKKANDAKSSAISTAASDATTKANNALSSAKTYSDGQIKTVNAAITQTNSEISAMKGQIALKVEQTDINKAVDGVTVGGRNLFRGTGTPHSNNSYLTAKYPYASEPLVAGETYTVTICVTPAEKLTHFYLYLSQGMQNLVALFVTGTKKQIISRTFTAKYYPGKDPSVNPDNGSACFYRFPDDGTVTSNTTIHWIKVEKGNKPTDWTPAPEDDEERLSSLESWKSEASLKITKDGIIGTVGSYYATGADVTALTGRVTQAESTIKQQSDSIALTVKKDGVISAINQTSESVKISANKISLTAAGLVEIINSGDTKIKAANLNLSATDVVNIINSGTTTIKASKLDLSASDVVNIINKGTTKIEASKLNLAGYVTVSDLSGSGTTTIDGSNIKTGKISTDRLDVNDIFAKDVTATGTITGATLAGAAVSCSGSTGVMELRKGGLNGFYVTEKNNYRYTYGCAYTSTSLSIDYTKESLTDVDVQKVYVLYADSSGVNIGNLANFSISEKKVTFNNPTEFKDTLIAKGLSVGDIYATSISVQNSGVKLYGSTPFIDFHFNKSNTDYTSRIIELESGKLNVNGAVFTNGGTIWGTGLTIDGTGTFNGDLSATRGLKLNHGGTSLYLYNESGTFCIMHTGTDGSSTWPIVWDFKNDNLAIANSINCGAYGTFGKGIISKSGSVFHTGSYTDPYPGKSCTIKSWGTVASLRFAAKGVGNTWLGAAKPDGAAYDTICTDANALVPGWRVRTADGAWVGASYAQDPGFRIYYCNASRLGGNTNGTDAIYTFGSSGIFYAKSVSQTSDEREKNILSGITEKYENLFMQLKPVLFNWKSGADGIHMGFGAQTTLNLAEKCGISANELAAVHRSETEEPWSMSYTEIVPLAVQMVQKAITSIDSTRKEVSALGQNMTARMESLQYQLAQAFDRIAALEKENKSLRQALS